MAEIPGKPGRFQRARFQWVKHAFLLLAITVVAILIQGYHPGLEDDAYYLAAIRKDLNPALFPHDADFFQLQFEATIFDKLIAWSIRLTRLPVPVAVLLWHFASIFLLLWCCRRIASKCFRESHARWAAVALVAALFTIPISGTGIMLVDQYLHPRALATVAILGAILATIEGRRFVGGLLLVLATLVHVIMAVFGISLCVFLLRKTASAAEVQVVGTSRQKLAVAALLPLAGLPLGGIPLGWLFEPGSAAWQRAAATRTFYFLARWTWYEWLGILAPLVLLWAFTRIASRNGAATMALLTQSLVWFGIFQMVVGLVIMLPSGLERLRPLEPMRYLHLVYLFLFLLMGGLAGKYVLKRHTYRWVLFFAPLCFGMWFAQRQLFPATEHLEMPGAPQRNNWVKAFAWIRSNTPADSLFAMDPLYMGLPGEDYHGFRALAERSMLADNVKDPGMVARVPTLAGRWLTEVNAESNWNRFQAADFKKLKTRFGVNWVLVNNPGVPGLKCPWKDEAVAVCRLD